MLFTILVVLTVYLLACYAYGMALLVRRGLAVRKQRTERLAHMSHDADAHGALTHRYPTQPTGTVTPIPGKAAAA